MNPSQRSHGARQEASSIVRGVEVQAPAKINLALQILRRRPDGYHDLDTVFQAVTLFDTLRITLGEQPPKPPLPTSAERQLYVAPDGAWLEIESPWQVPCDETNLILKGLRLVASETGRSPAGVGIRLCKRIPPGGGLAGGSADAAGIVAGVCALWNLKTDSAGQREWGARLGSDVPFCLLGGTARGLGRGERLTPIQRTLGFWVVLAKPDFSIRTAEAFQAFNSSRHFPPFDINLLVRALEESAFSEFLPLLHNTFEECLADSHPEIAKVREDLVGAGCESALLSGSGSTVWGLCRDESGARAAANRLKAMYPFVAAVCPWNTGPQISQAAVSNPG